LDAWVGVGFNFMPYVVPVFVLQLSTVVPEAVVLQVVSLFLLASKKVRGS